MLDQRSRVCTIFGSCACVLVIAAYVPFFVLPAMPGFGWGGDQPVTSRASSPLYPGIAWVEICLGIPLLWPAILGHLLLWAGAFCLAARRWRAAWLLGTAAMLAGFENWLLLLATLRGQVVLWGQVSLFLSLSVLVGAGLVGDIFGRPRKGDRPDRSKGGDAANWSPPSSAMVREVLAGSSSMTEDEGRETGPNRPSHPA